jgi:hypothetical protein
MSPSWQDRQGRIAADVIAGCNTRCRLASADFSFPSSIAPSLTITRNALQECAC